MPKLTLAESQAISKLAGFLYDFLPGNAHPYANQNISFAGVAASLNLEKFWVSGSKQPAIIQLLQNTLEHERAKFCSLIEEIVKVSFSYRNSKITREKIEKLNELVKGVGFKIPSLWDPSFLRDLPSSQSTPQLDLTEQIAKLKAQLMALSQMKNAHARGYAFEQFLNQLFSVHGLQPRQSFKLKGEQIDGAIDFNSEIYLLEARWRDQQTGAGDLLSFHAKVSGKAAWSRGVFISYSGFTNDGLEAFSHGRATNLICFSGQDLYFILENRAGLKEIIQQKVRKAAEEGISYISVNELTCR